MYLPYLRGKQFELLAVRDICEWHNHSYVYPIIEPVRTNISGLSTCLQSMANTELSGTLIINPEVGQLATANADESDLLLSLIPDACSILPCLLLHQDLTDRTLSKLLFLLGDKQFVVIHSTSDKSLAEKITQCADQVLYHILDDNVKSRAYKALLPKHNRVLLQDPFFRADKNSEYPFYTSYSDIALFFKEDDYVGFSDFATIGREYRDSGGPAFAVAIHITTYKEGDDQLKVHHFLSDTNDTPVNVGGKFREALGKFINAYHETPELFHETSACLELKTLWIEEHYPGLGYLKKLSLLHHVELIQKLLAS